jgi:hypothetical protein
LPHAPAISASWWAIPAPYFGRVRSYLATPAFEKAMMMRALPPSTT